MTIYEDDYGFLVDSERLYECPKCGHKCLASDMMADADCDDPDDAVYSDYCCPKCWTFWLFLSYWK